MIGKTNAMIASSNNNDEILKGIVERNATSITLPKGITTIGAYAFSNFNSLTYIEIPDGVKKISEYAFYSSYVENIVLPNTLEEISQHAFRGSQLTEIIIPPKVKEIGASAFYTCYSLTNVTFNYGLEKIGIYCFQATKIKELILPSSILQLSMACFTNCPIETLFLPKSLSNIDQHATFAGCNKLQNVTIEQGFNANYLNLSSSTLYSVETIVSWLEALADRTGLTTYTLTIGTTNLAKLTEEQIAIATAKNWTLA